jgi:hypothetical protein
MKWKKKGLICSRETIDLPWYKKNTMVPVPYLMNDQCLRIFVTMCDDRNMGRIGYVDVDPANPGRILDYSRSPVIDIGADGCFDDNGVVTSSLLALGSELYLYYSGYQACVKVPYMIFSGVAVSRDQGRSFTKLTSRVPMLDRIDGEVSTRCAPFIMRDGDTFRMWYTSDCGDGWVEGDGKKLPVYDLKHMASRSALDWPRQPGNVAVALAPTDEHGIAKSTIWREDGRYKIIYSIRSLSKGYRLGYGESVDGNHFMRMDNQVGIDVSESGWDSEMIAFAERMQYRDRTYLFYCGNHYGMDGMGYAELVEK